ncbi:MAG: transcription termination/antitermination protein NusG [Candidatus Dojkabacteria bacterium]|nr:MAG: transcription termination/antitermination protein NusG [Candidatus Dojkabacteria bacterium]
MSEKDTEKNLNEQINTEKNTNKKGEKYRWYIINGKSGQEKKIAKLIEQRIVANNLEDNVASIVVPTQEKIVIKKGKKQTVEERVYPGYILIKMVATEEVLHIIRNTEGVRGFIGSVSHSHKPTPLTDKEIESFTQIKQPTTYQSPFSINDAVKVVDGPFKDFVGSIQNINESKGQVTVLISMFGREVPVELDFLQVTKI